MPTKKIKGCYSEKEVEKKLKDFPEWKGNAKCTAISRVIAMPNFVAGLAFLAKVTVYAELLEHHPDVELSYGKVKITLTTHDAKGLTKKDFELAERIDSLKVK